MKKEGLVDRLGRSISQIVRDAATPQKEFVECHSRILAVSSTILAPLPKLKSFATAFPKPNPFALAPQRYLA